MLLEELYLIPSKRVTPEKKKQKKKQTAACFVQSNILTNLV